VDAPLRDGFLLDTLGSGFTLLALNTDAPETFSEAGLDVAQLALGADDDPTGALSARYLGNAAAAVYLIRPDQHVVARWPAFDETATRAALRRATGQE
jgi:3-(3-hydroxy-phenyl)propionate hydroxylase